MPRFVFQLDAVLEQRKRLERDRQLVVADLERQRVAIEARVKQIQTMLIEGRAALRSELAPVSGGLPRTVPLDRVRYAMGSSLHGVAQLRRAAVELAGVTKRLDSARGELMKAAVARKAVDKLRERQHARWKLEQSRKEASELDDLTLMRRGAGGEEGAWS